MEGFLELIYNLLQSNNYLSAVVIVIVSLLLARLLIFIFKFLMDFLAKRTHHKVDRKLVLRLETPILIVIILVGAQLAIQKIATSSVEIYANTINSIIIFSITYLFIGLVDGILYFWNKSKKDNESEAFHEEIIPLIKSLSKIILIIVALLILLQVWGVEIAGFLTSLGILGVALGFGFKDTMGNIFGGISLIVDNTLKKGDLIQLETGEMGEVIETNLRSTKIKTFDEDYLIIPNGVLANTRVTNYAQPTNTIRVKIPVSVAYGSDIAQTKEVLLQTLQGRGYVLPLPLPEARFLGMKNYSLDFELIFYIGDYRKLFTVIDAVASEIYNSLNRAKINIPFPTQTLHIADDQKNVSSLKTHHPASAKKQKTASTKKNVHSTTKNVSSSGSKSLPKKATAIRSSMSKPSIGDAEVVVQEQEY